MPDRDGRQAMTEPDYDRLRKLCAERCRKGECAMECEVCGAKVGFCEGVWEAHRRDQTRKKGER